MGSADTAIESLPLRAANEVFSDGDRVVVVAPHPDDETLGCGGAIALLQQRAIPVHILVVSDGTQSHPHSTLYPATKLRALREKETCAAAQTLGLSPTAVTFLRWPDTAVPHPGDPDFPAVVGDCRRYLLHHLPTLLFVPWQHDRHCDHRAAWKIMQHCLSSYPQPLQQFVYSIWGSPSAGLPALPSGETGWRLDISAVESLKRQAAMAHQSQTTNLIADDPMGFRLTPTMLNNLIQPWETYLEVT
ncbi:MAG: PIG-L deacetylase family protein [Phormidesmis sp.]